MGNGRLMDLAAWAVKADALMAYAQQTGVRIAAISTGPTAGDLAAADHPWQMAWWGAAMYGLDAIGYSDALYSASGAGANRAVIPPWPAQRYGTIFTDAAVVHGAHNAAAHPYDRPGHARGDRRWPHLGRRLFRAWGHAHPAADCHPDPGRDASPDTHLRPGGPRLGLPGS